MGKSLRSIVVIAACAFILLLGVQPSLADTTLEEMKQLLQKGLTLAELEEEIARLTAQEAEIREQIARAEEQIAASELEVDKTRQHAGKVLRSYYMGDRDNLWMMLFSSKSLSDALSLYEYYSMIIDNDQRTLTAYSDSFKKLTEAKHKLEEQERTLQDVKAAFIAERDKALAVQNEIDGQIHASSDAAALREELERFTAEWKEQGLPMFRKYLSAMSKAMQSLPELLNGDDASKYIKDVNLFQGSLIFSISDADLAAFLRSKDPLLNNVSFQFADGQFKAFGSEDQVEVSVTGRYVIENTPVNHLAFHVDQLTYEGLILPESSNRTLESEFDLGFTPSNYMKGVKVTEVTLADGFFSLKLKQ